MFNSPARPRPASIPLVPRVKVWLELDSVYAFGLGICEILQAIERTGSIKQAAAEVGKSYRHVWDRVKQTEHALGQALVETQVGGQGRRRSRLTPVARRLVAAFLTFRDRMFEVVRQEFDSYFD
jgi:molybdate transport system regulatory protein